MDDRGFVRHHRLRQPPDAGRDVPQPSDDHTPGHHHRRHTDRGTDPCRGRRSAEHLTPEATKAHPLANDSAAGIIRAAALHALLTGSLRWEGFAGAAELRNHRVGGALMGVGGVTALGCTIGQGLSGVSTLSITSVIALASILAGGFATVRYQAWQIEREPDETTLRRPA